jgi:DNA-binding NarL/FixJ family response regulator
MTNNDMLQKTRIHLADDHQILIDGIRTLLNTVTDFEVVGHSLNGSTIFKKSHKQIRYINFGYKHARKDGIEVNL